MSHAALENRATDRSSQSAGEVRALVAVRTFSFSLYGSLRKLPLEDDLNDELQFHIEMRTPQHARTPVPCLQTP